MFINDSLDAIMLQDPGVRAFTLTWIGSASFIALFLFALLYFGLPKRSIRFTRRCVAVLVNGTRAIEINAPIDEQNEPFVEPYSLATETEVLHPCEATNGDYYRAILLTSNASYFPVRETTFDATRASLQPKFVVDVNKGTHADSNEIKFI